MTIAASAPTLAIVDQVADEAGLEPEAVEQVLRLTAEGVQQAIERHVPVHMVFGSAGSGKSHAFVTLLAALAEAEREGIVDASTVATLTAVRNLMVHGRMPDRLVDALMPEQAAVPTPAAVLQARRNAQARNALLEEFGALRSHEVADLAQSRAANRAALANRWRTEQRVVAVAVGDELLYPGFQFTAEGRPHAVVEQALGWLASDPHITDWQAALWFATPTGWLGGRRPVDLLDDEPDAVADAARREVGDIAG